MPSFRDITGQTHIKEHLMRAIRKGQVSHAYLLSGEENMGKEMLFIEELSMVEEVYEKIINIINEIRESITEESIDKNEIQRLDKIKEYIENLDVK